jgi:hypothetical protein
VDDLDYLDFVGAYHTRDEVTANLRRGVYPPGQHLCKGGIIYRVDGVYCQGEYLRIVGRTPYAPTPKKQDRIAIARLLGVYFGRLVEAE